MEWFWAAFCGLGSWAMFALGRHFWRAPRRWAEQGKLDNGLGYTIDKSENPRSFETVSAGSRAYAGFAFFFASIAGIFALGWIWQAL